MKKIICALALALTATACTQGPTTPQEMRETYSNYSYAQKKDYVVTRSFSAVNASLRENMRKCFDKTETVRSTHWQTVGNMSMPVTSVSTYYFTTTARVTSARGEYAGYMSTRGRDAEGKQLFYLVDTKPSSRGTIVTIYGSSFKFLGHDGTAKNQNVLAWARGQSARCPDLP